MAKRNTAPTKSTANVEDQNDYEIKMIMNTSCIATNCKNSNIIKRLINIISKNNDFLRCGKDICQNNMLTINKFDSISLEQFQWEESHSVNPSWNYKVHLWEFIPYIIATHIQEKNDICIDICKDMMLGWMDRYEETDELYDFKYVWHDMGTALRVENIIAFIAYISENAKKFHKHNHNLLERLVYLLHKSGEILCKDSFYSAHTNHGLYQMKSLLLLSSIFNWKYTWKDIAIRRLYSELSFSFTAEGVHVENSPGYHIFVFKLFLELLEDYKDEFQGSEFAKSMQTITPKALEFTSRILRPDAFLPPLGDTEQFTTSMTYPAFTDTAAITGHNELLYATTKGKAGHSPARLHKIWPESGYAVFRSSWAKKEYGQACHIIIKAGCLARYHHHQDEGHILLYAFGEDWLIDSGLYNYDEKSPMRRYVRSRAGHNVPLITHTGYAADFEHRLRNWRIASWSEADAAPYVEMDIQVLKNVRHIRRVDYCLESMQLTVRDAFFCSDDLAREVTLLWHVPEEKSVILEDKVAVSVIGRNGVTLRLFLNNPLPLRIDQQKGARQDKIASFTALKFNKIEPSTVIRASYAVAGQASIVSRFQFVLDDQVSS